MSDDASEILADLFGDAGERGILRSVLQKACLDTGGTLADLTVLSEQVNSYQLDTPAFHAEGSWLAEQMVNLRVIERRIPLRGLHYALVSTTGLAKPNGEPYRHSEKDWLWLQGRPVKSYAQDVLDAQINTEMVAALRNQALAKLAGMQAEIDSINQALRTETDMLVVEIPAPIAPDPELSDLDQGKALVSSRWPWHEQTRALIARKHLSNRAAS